MPPPFRPTLLMKIALLATLLFGLAVPAALHAQGTPNSATVRAAAYNVSTQPATRTEPPPPVVNGPPREYVLLTGSSSLIEWEKYKAVPHDQFWGSFVRATRTRFQQLQKSNGNDPNAMYTWLVFEDGYAIALPKPKGQLFTFDVRLSDRGLPYHGTITTRAGKKISFVIDAPR